MKPMKVYERCERCGRLRSPGHVWISGICTWCHEKRVQAFIEAMVTSGIKVRRKWAGKFFKDHEQEIQRRVKENGLSVEMAEVEVALEVVDAPPPLKKPEITDDELESIFGKY